ncbi:MAG: capsule biosynthesis protein [Erythrobacter sp.]|jgi:capsular polysaccharide export protein
MAARPILSIPPFPGARLPQFAAPDTDRADDTNEPDALLDALARHRVGGCYWGSQPVLPEAGYVLDGTAKPQAGALAWRHGDDPWHLLEQASRVRLPRGDARAVLAFAAGRPLVFEAGDGSEQEASDAEAARGVARHLSGWRWTSPFDGRRITPREAIELCSHWRQLIDANRAIQSVMGIAYWKKPTVSPLLWAGGPVPYNRRLDKITRGMTVAVWRSRLSAAQRREIVATDPAVAEIEDGFIRSAGLGADCVPPLSIIVDRRGVHFDPSAPSEIEQLLQEGEFSADIRARARVLRDAIVGSGLSKYEKNAGAVLERPGGTRCHILVPGQVEDDRAVTSGGALPSNLELLRRARAEAGAAAHIIYKPHPDVLAGHRRGQVASSELEGLADQVETAAPISALIAMVDELHVNSSLAGFEALLRGKAVTVHGVPFYAGWGLTTDRGPIPARRTARRTLDELVAAALLLYPRYLDPVTGLPCPAEVLAERLAAGPPALAAAARTVVAVRRTAGRISRVLGVISRRMESSGGSEVTENKR